MLVSWRRIAAALGVCVLLLTVGALSLGFRLQQEAVASSPEPAVAPEPEVVRPQEITPIQVVDMAEPKRWEQSTRKMDPVPIPVLMYHEIAVGPNSLYVSPQEFAAHLEYLAQQGYTAITMEQMHAHFTRGAPVPPKPVVLTFDDGYSSYYTAALPLLKQYGWPGTLFVITAYVGKPGYVTWEQLQEAAAAGTEIGSHTVTHPELHIVSPSRLVSELQESRKVLESKLSLTVHFFCYPVGRHNDQVVAAVREAGYLGAVTTKPGKTTVDQDSFRWTRVRINKGVSPKALATLLQ